jgi:hypothetical protein
MSTLLPTPDPPMMKKTSPSLDVEADAFEDLLGPERLLDAG